MEQQNGPRCETDWACLELRDEPPGTVLSKEDARIRALVLDARGIPCRVQPFAGGYQLWVPHEHLTRARREVQLYRRENAGWPPPPPPAIAHIDNTLATLCVLLLLATFHNLTLLEFAPFDVTPLDWSTLGNAHAGKIRHGEWWRAVTALTLHADGVHLLGNLAIGGIFVVRLCRQFGAGLGWFLILASGTLGNLANAFLQPYHHRAVGASTAVFGAVGILAGLTLVRYRHALWKRWPLPIAGALGLLALLGTGGENTDLGAHLLGLCFGLPLGAATALRIRFKGRPRQRTQIVLALGSATAVLLAWWTALAFR